jgi:hypothetical protein
MKAFPSEFRALFDERGYEQAQAARPLREAGCRVSWFPLLVRRTLVDGAIRLLDERLGPFLKPAHRPIDRSTITGMERNYDEALPKTLQNMAASLNSERSKSYLEAKRIGLVAMLESASSKVFAEATTGFSLGQVAGLQVIRYRPTDYVGPHNDHHPESEMLRHGYIDVHVTLTSDGVLHQYLIYEENGFLNHAINVGIRSGVSVSRLPYWHQVTPLEAKPGREHEARRWLLLVSWEITRSRRRGKR